MLNPRKTQFSNLAFLPTLVRLTFVWQQGMADIFCVLCQMLSGIGLASTTRLSQYAICLFSKLLFFNSDLCFSYLSFICRSTALCHPLVSFTTHAICTSNQFDGPCAMLLFTFQLTSSVTDEVCTTTTKATARTIPLRKKS